MSERHNYLLSTTDAAEWAKAFCELNPVADEGLMLSWFASAIETGRSNPHQSQIGENVAAFGRLPLDTSEFCDRFGHSFLDDDGPVKVCRECFTSYRDDASAM